MSFRLEHRIGIAAPVAAVWDVLSDLEGWARWNPLYPRAEGRLGIGAPLVFDLAVPGEAVTTQRAQVIDWVPQSQIVWAARYGGGMVRATRYMELDALSETGCVFSNGEIFEGFGARFTPGGLRRRVRAAFATMGEALKAEVEARNRAVA